MAPAKVKSASVQSSAEANFVSKVCLPFLQAAQNKDGGWGFRPGCQSRAEPSAWALLALTALNELQASPPLREAQQRGFRFLGASQLPDGSWPASPGQSVGCWATSLACWALTSDPSRLASDSDSRTAVSAGLRWICADWPRDISLVWRIIRKLIGRRGATTQDERLRGWGWTPRTASWVEPTSFALIALSRAPSELVPAGARERCGVAKLLIYDRMCRGGGWNCGNPVVYGVAGEPLVEPTVWALLALRDEPDSEKKGLSLQWLEKNLSQMAGPGSLALAKVCLETYGRPWPDGAPKLVDLYETNEFLGNVTVAAWTCLALSDVGGAWLRSPRRSGS